MDNNISAPGDETMNYDTSEEDDSVLLDEAPSDDIANTFQSDVNNILDVTGQRRNNDFSNQLIQVRVATKNLRRFWGRDTDAGSMFLYLLLG